MTKKWILYIFILVTRYAYVETSCKIMDRIESCQYTVLCETRPGSVTNPTCSHEPNITFQIINSKEDNLSKGFFSATNFDSRVRIFTAMNNTWTTITGSAFSYYTKTQRINLSENQIRNIRPEAFRGIFTLRFLNLSSNLIESLSSNSLMAGETTASNIEILDLSKNKLMYIASEVFNQCSNLRELYLKNNVIEKFEDRVFNTLKNLTRLYLQNNKLTKLEMALINLKELKDLDISDNKITRILGFETNHLISLERVNMSNNVIKTIESNCFNQAFNLESLDLQNNYITSTIANVMFINNGKLYYLNFYNNNISKIEENAFQHNNLVYLNLDKNFISGEITETTFTGLQKIKNLNLSKQNITAINAHAFKEMTSLVNLNLSTNNIDVIDQSSFKNTNSLAVLDLSLNKIKHLNFLKDALTNLTEIYLNNNNIVVIPGYAFENQTLLKKLDISNNKINTIEQYSLPLNNLQFLIVSGNPITGSVKSNVLSPGKYLRYLDLSNLKITTIEDMALIDLPVLARLNLSYNAIEYIGQKNFFNLNNMISLDLSNNRLLNLQLNSTTMKSLNALYLNNNNISCVTSAIPNSTEILYLDISHNNISEFTGAAFENLKELRVLRGSYNKIRNFNNPQTNGLSKLQDLDLSSNQISVIDLSFYRDLVRVDISNNILNNVNNSLSQNLENLQVLNVNNNNISMIPPGIFQNAGMLKILNISSNNLQKLRYGSLRGLNNTEVIDISMNSITEIDVDVFHECKELKCLIIDNNHIKYLDIEKLIEFVPKLTHLSIGGNPLHCKQIVYSIRNTNKTSIRSVEITSVHKIFHEDNVNGIKCGDTDLTTSKPQVIVSSTSNPPAGTSHTSGLIVWCSILTILFILLPVAFLFWKYSSWSLFSSGTHSQTRMQFRNSVELNGSQFESDLLN